MELLAAPRSDDLSALLERINVRSVVYCLSDLGAPWGFRVDGSATAKFHLVLGGQATLTLNDPGATRVTLAAGELVLLAHGSGHLMQDRSGSPARPLLHILAEEPSDQAGRLTYRGGGPRTSLLCGVSRSPPGAYRRQQLAAHGVRAAAADGGRPVRC